MIVIETTAKNVEAWVQNLKKNITEGEGEIAKRLTQSAKLQLEVNAPVWKGTLKSNVASKLFPTSHTGEVSMATQESNMIAMENEYNISGERRIYKAQDPKIEAWATEKGVFTKYPYVIVGGRNTRLGRQNAFFLPSFMNIQAETPTIIGGVVAEAIMKTRG